MNVGMRRNCQLISILLSMTQLTFAAKQPVIAWGGIYAGLNAGYTFPGSKSVFVKTYKINPGDISAANTSVASGTGFSSLNNDGFIGGAQIGYNRNLGNNFVASLEGDIQWIANGYQTKFFSSSAINPTTNRSTITNTTISKNIDYLGTLRGRFGYLLTPNLLVSGTGGFAYGGVDLNTTINQRVSSPSFDLQSNWGTMGQYSKTRVGWTAGGHFEWVFLSNWSTKIEYLYYDLGTLTHDNARLARLSLTSPNALFINGTSTTTRFNGQLVRLGINYHFC